MRAGWRRYVLASLLLVSAPAAAQAPGSLGKAVIDPLRLASCPKGVELQAPEVMPLQARRVSLQGVNPSRKTIGALTLVDGFHLTSTDKRLGGLSGIDITDDGNLLAISDQGDFVWLMLGEDGVTPTAARIAGMRDAKGVSIRGKAEGDAEGLAVNDGLALVSFEGNHRILAFDLKRCGAAARGVPFAAGKPDAMTRAFARQKLEVGGNGGLEGLAVTPDWFVFSGLETKAGKQSALSARGIEARPEFDIRFADGAPELVGMDVLPDGDDGVRVFSLHRSHTPLANNAIMILETRFARELDQANLPARVKGELGERAHVRLRPLSSRVLAQMNVFLTIDNFEGIAAKAMPDGGVRLFVVSDDNFAARQRTLLMVYDVAAQG